MFHLFAHVSNIQVERPNNVTIQDNFLFLSLDALHTSFLTSPFFLHECTIMMKSQKPFTLHWNQVQPTSKLHQPVSIILSREFFIVNFPYWQVERMLNLLSLFSAKSIQNIKARNKMLKFTSHVWRTEDFFIWRNPWQLSGKHLKPSNVQAKQDKCNFNYQLLNLVLFTQYFLIYILIHLKLTPTVQWRWQWLWSWNGCSKRWLGYRKSHSKDEIYEIRMGNLKQVEI